MTFITYAQNYEDVMLWRALKHLETGFYVDIGANDPTIDSVTRAFYDRGWHGINIEPMQTYCERLKQERPKDINLCCAVGAFETDRIFYEIPDTGLSTFDLKSAEQARVAGWTIIEHEVHVLTLNKILSEHDTGSIHFLKIDAEGFEKEVLEGLDLARWRPWILVIESTIPNSAKTNHELWEYIVTNANYRFAYFDGLNRFYISDEHVDLLESLKTPPNYFDHFTPANHVEATRNLEEQKKRVVDLGTANSAAQSLIEHQAKLLDEKEENYQAASNIINQQASLLLEKDTIYKAAKDIIDQQTSLLHDKEEILTITRAETEHQATLYREKEAANRSEIDSLSFQLKEVRYELNSVYHSKSWRVTKPLRILFLPVRWVLNNKGKITLKLKNRAAIILQRGIISLQKKPFITRIAIKLKMRYPSQWRRLAWHVKKIALPPPPLSVPTSDTLVFFEDEQYYMDLFQHEIIRWREDRGSMQT